MSEALSLQDNLNEAWNRCGSGHNGDGWERADIDGIQELRRTDRVEIWQRRGDGEWHQIDASYIDVPHPDASDGSRIDR